MRMKWSLDRKKFLDLRQVQKLRRTLNREMKRAVQSKDYLLARKCFAVELALESGLRVSELAKVRHSDFETGGSRSFLRVRKGKGDRQRLVQIGKRLTRKFREFTAFKKARGIPCSEEGAVFCKVHGDGLSTRSLQLAFKNCAAKAGLEPHYSIHCLRHTYGTHLYLASGHNLRFVQKQLGHSSISITEVYADVLEDDADKALQRLYC